MDPRLTILAAALWIIMAIFLLEGWMEYFQAIKNKGVAVILALLVIVTAPCLMINDIMVSFLDAFFPEGWQDRQ